METIKKTYIRPQETVTRIETTNLLAGSVTDDGNIDMGSVLPGDADEAAAPGMEFMRLLWTLMLFMVTVGMQAQTTTMSPADAPDDGQTHAMTLYLRNDTQVSYELTELDHVTYLPGIGMKVYLKGSTTSIDYLYSQMEKVEYGPSEDLSNTNANWRGFDMGQYTYAYRLEYPRLDSNTYSSANTTGSQVIVKQTRDYGITYSLEWDNQKIANRWTCYTLHEGNSLQNVSRDDAFKADTDCAVQTTPSDYSNSGFSRGHLCPSADRLCSTEQNKQTFFLSNMQPQYQAHNGGLWSNLETLVRNYATSDDYSDSHCDTLYIVKAATISDKVTIDGSEVDGLYDFKCNDRLPVPKYFYMALLHYNKETATYHAVAFWTEHLSTGDTNKNYGDYAISIDELERRTGIDFFCNLPDDIEAGVESSVDLNFWHLTKSK